MQNGPEADNENQAIVNTNAVDAPSRAENIVTAITAGGLGGVTTFGGLSYRYGPPGIHIPNPTSIEAPLPKPEPSIQVDVSPTDHESPLKTHTPLPTFDLALLSQTCQNFVSLAREANLPEETISEISDAGNIIVEIGSSEAITQAQLTTLEETCHTVTNHFAGDANTTVAAACQTIFKEVATKFAIQFCADKAYCQDLLKLAIEHAPTSIGTISSSIEKFSQIPTSSIINLNSIRDECLSITNHFSEEGVKQTATTICHDYFINAVAQYAPDFSSKGVENFLTPLGKEKVIQILNEAAKQIPEQLTTVAEYLAEIRKTQLTSLDAVYAIRDTCSNVEELFVGAVSTAPAACQTIIGEAASQILNQVVTSSTPSIASASNQIISITLSSLASLNKDAFSSVVTGLGTLQNITPDSMQNVEAMRTTCDGIAMNFQADTYTQVANVCQGLFGNVKNLFVDSVCAGTAMPGFKTACANLIDGAMKNSTQLTTYVIARLQAIKNIPIESLQNLHQIQNECSYIKTNLAGSDYDCQLIVDEAMRVLSQASYGGVSDAFTNTCAQVLSTVINLPSNTILINGVYTPIEQHAQTTLSNIRDLATQSTVTLADVQNIEQSCESLLAISSDEAIQTAFKDACHTLGAEALKKVGYFDRAFDFVTRQFAERVAYGVGYMAEKTGNAAGAVSGFVGDNALAVKEGITSLAAQTKQAAIENPWTTTGVVAITGGALFTTAYYGYKHRASIGSGLKKAISTANRPITSMVNTAKSWAGYSVLVEDEKRVEENVNHEANAVNAVQNRHMIRLKKT